jgi:hypothetical protein
MHCPNQAHYLFRRLLRIQETGDGCRVLATTCHGTAPFCFTGNDDPWQNQNILPDMEVVNK